LALRNPQRTDVRVLARTLDEQVMRPVRAILGSTRRLFISPDGSLNLIPFAALVNEHHRYLVESYEISYLTSGRDLLRLQIPRESRTGPLVVADPAFGRANLAYAASRKIALPVESHEDGISHADFSRAYFPPLPGTGGEARALKAFCRKSRF
jgi:CHAT domain-containing protein